MKQQLTTINDQILDAIEQSKPLRIRGGDSKAFIGRNISAVPLEMGSYKGIIDYEPTELFVTARAGTSLIELKQALTEKKQMLAFEPPEFSERSTVGGVIATGLSGPRRAYSGSVRDYVLGIKCINGLGKELTFGGQVMKNVAGYDLSRLMTGAFGTLGVILEVSLKVMPLPEYELTCYQTLSADKALTKMHDLSVQNIPVSASCYDGEFLFIRLSGNEKRIKAIQQKIGFDEFQAGKKFWADLRDYRLSFFNTDKPIWRLSVPITADLDFLGDSYLIDWGGAQYWLGTNRQAVEIFNMASEVGGSAMLVSGGNQEQDVFQPLSSELLKLQQGLKQAFDPHRILNPGKMYAEV